MIPSRLRNACIAALATSLLIAGGLLAAPGGSPRRASKASAAASDAGPHAAAPAAENPVERTERLAKAFQSGVDVLAADDMEGRGLGTAGLRKAADWIEARLRAEGLEPAFGASYRQSFQVKTGVAMRPGNRLGGVANGDWTPLGFSSAGEFSGELAFVGYGIEAPSLGYRELEGIDLHGKVALMLRYEPQEKDEGSPFDGRSPSRWSAMRYKVLQARERGAAAVVFVTGPLQDDGKDRIPALVNDGPESPAGIPVLQVRISVARRWLARAGIDLDRFQADVDRDLVPRSRSATGVTVRGSVDLEQEYAAADNVGGVLPGRGPLASEVVVVGAHYDHLGMGGEKSMRPNVRAIHNGADDNASGVMSAMLIGSELSRLLGDAPSRRTVVIALFSAEEVGLGGSSAFVRTPPFPLERIVAMMNLDMVGMLRDDQLIVYGTDTAAEWADAVAKAGAAVPGGLKLTTKGDGYGPSDQTSFYAAGIPVLFLFTGQHERYHTPEDDPRTLNAPGAAKVIQFASAVLRELLLGSYRPTYERASASPSMRGDSRGYGAYLGTVPDYRAMEATEGGVLLADVRPGGPAALAGIKGGDTIVEMAGTKIQNLYDMTYALQDNKPGDTIVVVVMRKGERVALKATLGDRQTMGAARPGASPSTGGASAAAPGPSTPGAPAASAAPAAMGGPSTTTAARPRSESAQAGTSAAHGATGQARADAAHPASSGVSPFYESRPGPGFTVAAGKPYAKTSEGEHHLKDIRQLTFGGENAEAYFSPDGTRIIYQSTPPGAGCDQQYVMDLSTGETKRVSDGKGRTTCGYFRWPQGDRIIYASTENGGDACPPVPDRSKGYVWALYDTYDIWEASADGSGARRITTTPGYDAEATWCHRGGKFIFTSVRDGDLDLYTMDEAGDVKRITCETGYDGGAFFSPDCQEIVWRASRPTGEDLKEYEQLLGEGLIRPKNTEIFVARADGASPRQLTSNGAANFCPDFTADGRKIIFTSNVLGGRQEFELYLISKEGGEPERITFSPGFDGFPVFSPDGRWLVWASNRAAPDTHETNLFIARWIE